MTIEQTYQSMTFGFGSEEEFVQKVKEYVNGLRQASSEYDNPEDLDLFLAKKIQRLINRRNAQIDNLEEQLLNPNALYLYVLSIYLKVVELENDGKSRMDIADQLLETDGEKIMKIFSLLETGLNQKWAYILMQEISAAKTLKNSI
ncbi:MAG: hypothetical protein WDZ94_00645 [Patescibacteria group bacterium]